MRVIVDTSVWSLFLRRRRPGALAGSERRLNLLTRDLITDGLGVLTGPVRQELLSGIREGAAFDELSEYLRYFDDEVPEVGDYELAARFDNRCRAAGVASTPTDMLLCALGYNRDLPILTTDGDFAHYARHLSVHLYPHP